MLLLNKIAIFFSKENQGRGVERIKRAGLTGASAMTAQGITIAAGFISVPLTVSYLGAERYGIWLTINALLQWLYISNIGLSGNALVNKLSEANGRDDKKLAQELVSTAFWTLGALSIILLLVFAVSLPFVNWAVVFNTGEAFAEESKWAAIFAFVCFVLMFPMSMVDAVYQSYQEGYIGNIWNIAGSVFSLITLVVVTQLQGGLPLLVVSLFGVRVIFSVISAGYLFYIRHPWLKPRLSVFDRSSFRQLTSLGATYLVAQLASIAVTQSQPFIITQILGPAAVGSFNLGQRLMFLPGMFIMLFVQSFMPAYGEAKARNDWKWIRRTLFRTLSLSVAASIIPIALLVLFAQKIVEIWVKSQITVSSELILGLGIHSFIGCVIVPMSVMLYGLEKIKGQATVAIISAIVFLPSSFFLTGQFGEVGLIVSMLIPLVFVQLTGQVIQVVSVLKKKRNS